MRASSPLASKSIGGPGVKYKHWFLPNSELKIFPDWPLNPVQSLYLSIFVSLPWKLDRPFYHNLGKKQIRIPFSRLICDSQDLFGMFSCTRIVPDIAI